VQFVAATGAGANRVAIARPFAARFWATHCAAISARGYSGQSPVNDTELNLCLVAKPRGIGALKTWAANQFALSPDHVGEPLP
jgi:hypothetical protein